MHGPSKLDMEWVEVNRCCSNITRFVCRVNPHTHLIEVGDTCCQAGRDGAIVRKASLRAATVKLKGKQGDALHSQHLITRLWKKPSYHCIIKKENSLNPRFLIIHPCFRLLICSSNQFFQFAHHPLSVTRSFLQQHHLEQT